MIDNYFIGKIKEHSWGYLVTDEIGEGFMKRTILINADNCLSLQSNNYLEKNWSVIEGRAEVTIGDKVFTLTTGNDILIPKQTKHLLRNMGKGILIVKEIQTGEIIDENAGVSIKNGDTVYIADMDGTLTPARLPMTAVFADFLESFVEQNTFYIISGSDLKKVQEQIPPQILDKVSGIYCSMGNEFFIKNELVYSKEFSPSSVLLEDLEKYRQHTTYPGKLFPNYIEKRRGMVNFSILGRDCTLQARIDYKSWDDIHHERRNIAEQLIKKYPEYDISLGGNISIDIVPHGFGKEQIASILREKYPNKKIIFLGDRTERGGNDYSLAQAILKIENTEVVTVCDSEDALMYLKKQAYGS